MARRSLKNLDVHPDLKKVAHKALKLLDNTPYDFIVTDGGRTIEEQREFVRKGASKTMKSRHLGGLALDYVAIVMDGPRRKVTYDKVAMKAVANAFKAAGTELSIPVEWGGDWKTFVDMPHIQLNAKKYPS
jgi:peptidoglycan L-alanyl-D-glutamate endopeptidase CwlK